jgi:tyrosyl-tRNA synthetase
LADHHRFVSGDDVHIFDDLKWRGLIYGVSDEKKVRAYLAKPGAVMYCGFDPTAVSLHVGNLVPLLSLLRLQRAGHRPIALMGGGTVMIGDPSGKDEERSLLTKEVIDRQLANIAAQVDRIFDGRAWIENNHDWLAPLSAIGLLRDVGKHFTVNWMMQKDSVKSRLGREDVGISYTEFSYMILQAYDFYWLAREHGCMLQIGGSDQWGNITAGSELIRRKLEKEGLVLTFPLITTASGKKFGKSEKGAVYLDPELTSPYDFYQYWVRADDRDVGRFLRFFTFLSHPEIEALEAEVEAHPEQRQAQKILAREMTRLVHGEAELASVEAATSALYGRGDVRDVAPRTLRAALETAPSINYPSIPAMPDLAQTLLDLGLVASKGQAKKDIKAGGVYVNNLRVTDAAYTPGPDDLIHGELLLLRKGKKHYGLVSLG